MEIGKDPRQNHRNCRNNSKNEINISQRNRVTYITKEFREQSVYQGIDHRLIGVIEKDYEYKENESKNQRRFREALSFHNFMLIKTIFDVFFLWNLRGFFLASTHPLNDFA